MKAHAVEQRRVANAVRTQGEESFARYLLARGRSFRYEALVGVARPDFSVEDPSGPVSCEVIDPQAEPSQLLDEEHPWRIGSSDPYVHIRRSIDRKRRQGRGARGRQPYVLVLHPTDLRPYGPSAVMGAMFGDLAFSIPVAQGPATPRPPAQMVFSDGGRIQPEMNLRFSAVAVLRTVNPTGHTLDAELRRRSGRPNSSRSWPSTRHVIKHLRLYERVRAAMTRTGSYDPDLVIERVDVVHNPYALTPLPWTFFDGPYDRQWAVPPGDGRMRLVAVGMGGRILGEDDGFG